MDRIDELLFEVLRQPDDRWSKGVEELCAQQGEHSTEIRRRFTVLRELGLESVAPVTPPPDFPERLGDFRLKERLGGGGMGVVYLAEQVSLQRTVALKLLRPELLYFPKAKDRFRREVETVARLAHPGIVAIHAVGEEQGIEFFAMEHIAGVSLEHVLRELAGKAPERLAGADVAQLLGGSDDELYAGSWPDVGIRIVRRVAEALGHAHARGVIHRDVKPSNVMLTRDGRVVLLDFGLAVVQGAGRVTRTGAQLGSLPYMSPEQVRGEHERVDARSDVYSLGVTLYELLTLRSPFEASSAETTRRNILLGTPPAVRLLNRQVSSDAAIVCGKALELDPRRRYQSAADLARDLENLLAHKDIEARPPTIGRRARLWVQRHPAAAVGLVAGTLLLVGTPTAITFAIAGQRDRARAAEALALRHAYAANLTATATALQTGNAVEARRRHAMCPPALRGWEWHHLALRLDSSLRTMRGHAGEVTAVALASDARLAASGASNGEVIVWDTGFGAEVRRLRLGEEPVAAVAFDPQAQRVYVTDRKGAVGVFDRTTGEPMAQASPGESFATVVLGPYASPIWRHCGGWKLEQLDPATLTVRRVVQLEPDIHAPGEHLAICADCLLADAGPVTGCWNLESGRLLRSWPVWQEATVALAFDRAGHRVARGGEHGTVLVLPVQAGQAPVQIDAGTPPMGLAFNPAGDLLAVAGRDGSVRVFDAAAGQLRTILHGHDRSVSAVACEAYDISLLLTGSTDGTVRLWSALTTPAVTTLSRHASVLTVAPDGNRLFSGSHDASLCIWDPNSGMPLRRIAGPYPHWVNAIAASPDGTTLLVGTQGRVLVQAAADGTVRDNLLAGTMVRRCIYSRDGARFATGHDNGVVAVWDARSEVQLWRLEGHQDRIRGLAFGEDPDVLFSGDEKGLVLRWDLKGTPSPTTLCADRGLCRALLLTPGAGSLLCAHENWLRSLDPDSGAVQWERPQAEPLRSLAVLADGSRVLTGSRDGTLTFWDAADGEPLLSFRAHDKDIYALACDPRGQWCATAAEDGRIRIWRRPVPGADAPAIDGAGLLLQVALHYCDELFKREILARRALRIAQTRSDWSPGLRAKVCELLPLHGGSGAWPAIARVFDLLRHPNPPPADLERARGLMEEAAFESTLSKSADVLLQLRTGRYAQAETEAAALLARHPPDMGAVLEASLRAARAMSLHRLGRAAEAGAELEQLRTLSRQPTAALEPVVLAFLDETEAVLGR